MYKRQSKNHVVVVIEDLQVKNMSKSATKKVAQKSGLNRSISVSYTHLDVYKRQGMDVDRMGGCAGLGGENGRSNGSAVSSSAARGCPQAGLLSVLGFIWMMNCSLAACSRQNAPPPPSAATLLETIAAADPAKYPSPQASRRWSNPYLVIRPDAVGLVTGVTANEEQILQPGEVLNCLLYTSRCV